MGRDPVLQGGFYLGFSGLNMAGQGLAQGPALIVEAQSRRLFKRMEVASTIRAGQQGQENPPIDFLSGRVHLPCTNLLILQREFASIQTSRCSFRLIRPD